MCMAVYIGADVPLPIIKWDERTPSFHIEYLGEEHVVRRQFRPFDCMAQSSCSRVGSSTKAKSLESRGALTPAQVAAGALEWDARQFYMIRAEP